MHGNKTMIQMFNLLRFPNVLNDKGNTTLLRMKMTCVSLDATLQPMVVVFHIISLL